ncbi:unnamed protein product [Prunus brigantina]
MIQHGGSCWINKKVRNHHISPMQLQCSVMTINKPISSTKYSHYLKEMVSKIFSGSIMCY